MEFIKQNLVNTTTQIAVDSNTTLAENLFNRNKLEQYVSVGFGDDLTTTSITISFSSTQTVDRIGLVNHNIKEYDIFYNGATANTFAFTTTASTNTSQFSSNSETSQYFRTTPVAVTSVTLDLKATIEADNEKAIGLLFLSEKHFEFDRIPSAKNYRPEIVPKQVIQSLSDGGTRLHSISEKLDIRINFENITSTFRDQLKSVYDLFDPFVFVPFGTSTGWSLNGAILSECVWSGRFNFYRYSDDAVNAGFSGNINLKETPF